MRPMPVLMIASTTQSVSTPGLRETGIIFALTVEDASHVRTYSQSAFMSDNMAGTQNLGVIA